MGEFFDVDFSLGQKLGQGACGTVYKCQRASDAEFFAVKVISKATAEAQSVQLLRSEAQILGRLDHPHIVQVIRFYESPSACYLVEELLEGGDLLDKIVELKHYTESAAMLLTGNIVATIKYLHTHWICHRDIKPENLLLKQRSPGLSSWGQPQSLDDILCDFKLVDFGVATTFSEDNPWMNQHCGSPDFMAPEIIRVKKNRRMEYNCKCDMWSIGVLTYILLCGWPPFIAQTDEQLERVILRGEFQFHKNTVWDQVSDQAKDFVSKLLVVDPTKRMDSREALEHPWLWSTGQHRNNLNQSLSRLRRISMARSQEFKDLCIKPRASMGVGLIGLLAGVPETFKANDTSSLSSLGFPAEIQGRSRSVEPSPANKSPPPYRPKASIQNARENGQAGQVSNDGSTASTSFQDCYALGPQLAKGEDSVVYKCVSHTDGCTYAVKVVDRRASKHRSADNLLNEVALLRTLNHPQLITVHAFFDDHNQLFLVQPLMTGGDLLDKIVDWKYFTEGAAMRLVRTLVGTVSYLHSNRICHRDIKPENILLKHATPAHREPRGDLRLEELLADVVLIDFGNAVTFTPGEPTLTGCVSRVDFTSPEMVLWRKNKLSGYTEQCDLWSVGVVAYILLCGWPPFTGRNSNEKAHDIVKAKYHPFEGEVWDIISDDATDFIAKLLVADPAKRMTLQQAKEHRWLWATGLQHTNLASYRFGADTPRRDVGANSPISSFGSPGCSPRQSPRPAPMYPRPASPGDEAPRRGPIIARLSEEQRASRNLPRVTSKESLWSPITGGSKGTSRTGTPASTSYGSDLDLRGGDPVKLPQLKRFSVENGA
eukprot:GGOE01003864.1.p1 GENE.GGOE01003864.1~~GGOE01003864.1.p1  ORF type:complete len:826 (-),score=199.73 GGOE01003864.1:376-2853(-)